VATSQDVRTIYELLIIGVALSPSATRTLC
jgi:hypothetical protein